MAHAARFCTFLVENGIRDSTAGSTLENPHDKLFQFTFQHPLHAGTWLAELLPAPLRQAINWAELRPAKERLADSQMRPHVPDVVMTAPRLLPAGSNETASQVWFVIEHKSYPESDLHAQLLRYVVHLDRTLSRKGFPHGIVIATVLQHGPPTQGAPPYDTEARPDPPGLNSLDSIAKGFQALQPHLPYLVDDISKREEGDLRNASMTPLVRLTMLCLQFLPRLPADEVPGAFERWADLLRCTDRLTGQPLGADAIDAVGWYALAVTDVVAETLSETFSRILYRPEDSIMSTLERTFLRGQAQGKADGELEGRAETILRMLELRFGTIEDAIRQRVRGGSVEQLARWTDRILTGTSSGDVLLD